MEKENQTYDENYYKKLNRQNGMRNKWDEKYAQNKLMDWELIDPENMKNYINSISINKQKINRILEYGCGRGFRVLSWVLLDPDINREDVYIKCIDISNEAIKDAKRNLEQLKNNKFPDDFVALTNVEINNKKIVSNQFVSMVNDGDVPEIKCKIEFVNKDLFSGFPAEEKYDLVIDWMCFHELAVEYRRDYVKITDEVCENYYMLTVFCKDTCDLPIEEFKQVADGIPKYMFSCQEIRQYFGIIFDQISAFDVYYPSIRDKVHSDGMVFPKKSYFMVKKNRKLQEVDTGTV